MFRYFSILIYGILALLLLCCQNNTNKIASANKKSASIKEMSEKNSDNAMSVFSDSLLPLGTIVKERQIKDKLSIETETTDIQVYLLPNDSGTNNSFLMAEIVNHTPNTISLINDVFLMYNEQNNSWRALRYPEDYSRPDIKQLISPGKSQLFRFYFPLPSNYHRGKYRLQLTFSNFSYNSYYYIYKDFLIK